MSNPSNSNVFGLKTRAIVETEDEDENFEVVEDTERRDGDRDNWLINYRISTSPNSGH